MKGYALDRAMAAQLQMVELLKWLAKASIQPKFQKNSTKTKQSSAFSSNGARECERRRRQIAAGQLTVSNGYAS